MKKQRSRTGMGMLLTLLMLGLSHKGNYGEVPTNFPDSPGLPFRLSAESHPFAGSGTSRMNSLFIRNQQNNVAAMIVLVVYDRNVARQVQATMRTRQTALLFSVSTLPATLANFDPRLIQFRQAGRQWHPNGTELDPEFFPMFSNAQFGGAITEGAIHHGIVLVPEWFDLRRPITISYLNCERTFAFE